MLWFKITCPYCREKIPLSSLRCPKCRSIIPHEYGEEERKRFLKFGCISLILFAAGSVILLWVLFFR